MTPGLRTSPAPDQSKVTCFNCNEVGHYAGSCLNPHQILRINEIGQDDHEVSGDEAHDEADSDSESEN